MEQDEITGRPPADAARLASGRWSLPWRREGGVPRTVIVQRDGRAHQVVLTSPPAREAAERSLGGNGWKLFTWDAAEVLAYWRNPGTWLLVDPGTPNEQVWDPAALRTAWAEKGIPSAGGAATGPQDDPQPVAVPPSQWQFNLLYLVILTLGSLVIRARVVTGSIPLPLLLVTVAAAGWTIFSTVRFVRVLRYGTRLRGVAAVPVAVAGAGKTSGLPTPRPVRVAVGVVGAYGALWALAAVALLIGAALNPNGAFLVIALMLVVLLATFVYVSSISIREALSGASRYRITFVLRFTGWLGWLGLFGIVSSTASQGVSGDVIIPGIVSAVIVATTEYGRRQLDQPEAQTWFTAHADLA